MQGPRTLSSASEREPGLPSANAELGKTESTDRSYLCSQRVGPEAVMARGQDPPDQQNEDDCPEFPCSVGSPNWQHHSATLTC